MGSHMHVSSANVAISPQNHFAAVDRKLHWSASLQLQSVRIGRMAPNRNNRFFPNALGWSRWPGTYAALAIYYLRQV